MEKQNLSKLKKQDLLNKKAGQKMSGEVSLSDELKGDKAFTDQHAEHGDENYGGKMKVKDNKPKFATTSKTEPKNGKLDSEKTLSNKLKGGNTKFSDENATDCDNKVKNDHSSKNGSGTPGKGKTTADSELSRIAESGPTFNNVMNFGQFVLEACMEDDNDDKCDDDDKSEEADDDKSEEADDDKDDKDAKKKINEIFSSNRKPTLYLLDEDDDKFDDFAINFDTMDNTEFNRTIHDLDPKAIYITRNPKLINYTVITNRMDIKDFRGNIANEF